MSISPTASYTFTLQQKGHRNLARPEMDSTAGSWDSSTVHIGLQKWSPKQWTFQRQSERVEDQGGSRRIMVKVFKVSLWTFKPGRFDGPAQTGLEPTERSQICTSMMLQMRRQFLNLYHMCVTRSPWLCSQTPRTFGPSHIAELLFSSVGGFGISLHRLSKKDVKGINSLYGIQSESNAHGFS